MKRKITENIVRCKQGERATNVKTDWARVDEMTDKEIEANVKSDPDTELLDEEFFKHAKLVEPAKKRNLTIRYDIEVIDWFKRKFPKGYQTKMNAVLKTYVNAHQDKRKKVA